MHISAIVLSALFVLSATPLARADHPSKMRRFCEEVLIAKGLYHPKKQAVIVDHGYEVQTPLPYVVSVKLPGQENAVAFSLTNRDRFEIVKQRLLPAKLVDPEELRGKKVADLACGDGCMVEDLRRADVDVVGVDVVLSEYQKSKPYFVQASMDDLPFEDKSMDVLYSTMGPIRYMVKDRAMMQRFLNEAHRVLKTGGVFRVSPIELEDLFDPEYVKSVSYRELQHHFVKREPDALLDLLNTGIFPLPQGLRIKAHADSGWFSTMFFEDHDETRGPYYWVEFERVD